MEDEYICYQPKAPRQIQHPSHPPQIQHPFHPLYALTFYNRETDLHCHACKKGPLDFTFRCKGCEFDLDSECALLVPNIKYEGHEHLLTLFHKIHDDSDECLCNSCGTRCSALVLRCVDCNFNVHKSCAHQSFVELPTKIKHPFHPLHYLTLTDHPPRKLRCDACRVRIDNFSFRCEECDFTLGNECTSLAPTIICEGHHHLLTRFDEFAGYFLCKSCNRICHGFVFRCVNCDFDLHTRCLPSFPRTIQHQCHICPLTLTHSVPEDDDTDEYYCDACEKERDQYDSVYYCADCSFVAHIKCVISEVLPLLDAGQEKIVWPKKAEIRHASTVEGLLGASVQDEVMERGVSVAMPSGKVGVEFSAGREKFGVEVIADPVLAKLEGDIAKLQAEVEVLTAELVAQTAKLESVKNEHAEYVASKLLNSRDKYLSEASTSE